MYLLCRCVRARPQSVSVQRDVCDATGKKCAVFLHRVCLTAQVKCNQQHDLTHHHKYTDSQKRFNTIRTPYQTSWYFIYRFTFAFPFWVDMVSLMSFKPTVFNIHIYTTVSSSVLISLVIYSSVRGIISRHEKLYFQEYNWNMTE